MTVFDELNEQYAKFDAAINLQCSLLVKAAGDLASGFEKYLGITSGHWNHEDGRRGDRYVRLGVGSPRNFEEKIWPSFLCEDGVVSFSIALTLEDKEASRPRFHYVYQAAVRFVNEGYEFSFTGEDQPIVVPADQIEIGNFDLVCEDMVDQIKFYCDPQSVLIKRSK